MRLEMTRVASQPMSSLNAHVCPISHRVLGGDRPRVGKMSSDLRGRATPESVSYSGQTWPLFYVVYGTEYWICTYNIVVRRGNVDLVDIISCTPSPFVMSKGLIPCVEHTWGFWGGIQPWSAKKIGVSFCYTKYEVLERTGGMSIWYIRSTYAIHSTHFNNGRDAVDSSHEKCSVVCSKAGIWRWTERLRRICINVLEC